MKKLLTSSLLSARELTDLGPDNRQENLRILVCEGVQLNIKAREVNDAAIKETFGDMLKILDGIQGEEGYEDAEATARRQATRREADTLSSLSEALGKIFWYELKMSLPEDVPNGTIGISKNWEVYFQKDDGVKRCTLHGIIIPVE